jgi:hypothetical protein
MAIELSLRAADLNEDELQELTRELRDELQAETAAEVTLNTTPVQSPTAGIQRKSGEWELVGQLVLKGLGVGLGGGGSVALVNVLKTYLQRKPTLEIEIKRKGGDTIKVKADDLSKAERQAVLQQFLSADESKS